MEKKNLDLPKIFINSVPKSATNLLIQLIRGISEVYDGNSYWAGGKNDVLNIKNGELVYSHIPYYNEFSNTLQSRSIKQIFIYRDLRDVAVSMVHFINDKFYDHPLHQVFKERIVLFEDQLDAVILGVDLIGEENLNKWGIKNRYPGVYESFKKIYEWRIDPSVCSLRYEDLVNVKSADYEIMKIINFLWEDLKTLGISKKELLRRMKNNIAPQKTWTFRKGKVGSWREEFTDRNIINFKKVTGDFIIQIGYESHLDW
ncbi:sulfotransferase domain-containing protein [Cytobacillus sp. BC1816]|uniref:sulfotransferase domain-containing protein n=1 Tax=Cytobacillus sp. BC1816 TaxID=3440154 RepID=UPI003F510991